MFGNLVLQTSSIIMKHRGINSADLAFEHEMFVYLSVFVTSAIGFSSTASDTKESNRSGG